MSGKGRRGSFWGFLPLYLAFAATGIGVALPGVLLPVLLPEWRLADAQGGRLLFLAWAGSSAGALLVRGKLRQTLFAGSILIVAGAATIALCSGIAAGIWFALYGIGLGMVMTSVSLMRQHQTGGSGTEMVRLNLVWAVGASVCPALMATALKSGNDRPVLYGLATYFAVMAGWCLWRTDGWAAANGEREQGKAWQVFRRVPPALIVLTVLITGVEASAGGWLATYAWRGTDGTAVTIAAPTFFWAGLLMSRALWSLKMLERIEQSLVVRGSLVLMALGAASLLAGSSGWALLLSAGCLGFGIGPVYPLVLAWALRFHKGGAIFFLAGVGAAVLPWATGIVSTAQGSLRRGLAVPATGVAVMLGLALMMPLPAWSRQTRPHEGEPG